MKTSAFLKPIADWINYSDRYVNVLPDSPDCAVFGTGYGNWGVQTEQKYIAALGVLGASKDFDSLGCSQSRETVIAKAVAALRYDLRTYQDGPLRRTDGSQWGKTWISALGVERMMHAVSALEPYLLDSDRSDIRRMLVSEANYQLTCTIDGHVWVPRKAGEATRNKPESNYWNGAILVRAAAMFPDEKNAPNWRDKGISYLINAVSIPADATDMTIVDGMPVMKRHLGANFFPNYALDHHAYLNVGYMVICLSNAAMLHYAFKDMGAQIPQSAYHHIADLWNVVKRFTFEDGRLARIGGDTRARYCYCQDYLLPSLLFIADHFKDPAAAALLPGALSIITREQELNKDGSFLSERCGALKNESPYYYTRLETDRAAVLSLCARWQDRFDLTLPDAGREALKGCQGAWSEPEHGAIFVRGDKRLASWSWLASEPPQGLCQPPDDGNFAEWEKNLAGGFLPIGVPVADPLTGRHPQVIRHTEHSFDGGFATIGTIDDIRNYMVPEGLRYPEPFLRQFAVAALPDDLSMIVMEYSRLNVLRLAYIREIRGLKLNIPNDIFNGRVRRYQTASGERIVSSPPLADETLALNSRWVTVDGRLSAVGIYGADTWTLQRTNRRVAGFGGSLFVDELCFPGQRIVKECAIDAPIADRAALFLSDSDAKRTERLAGLAVRIEAGDPALPDAPVRAVIVRAGNERDYIFVANFGDKDCWAVLTPQSGWTLTRLTDVIASTGGVAGQDADQPIHLPSYGIRLFEMRAAKVDASGR